MTKKKNITITREKWLRRAVEILDTKLFNGDLDLYNRQFQISVGRCPGIKMSESVFPYDGEDVNLDDFFPVTMQIDWQIKDPIEMLGTIALECVHAFFDERKVNKRFKQLADKYYFGKPYNRYTPTDILEPILKEVHDELVSELGEFPGYPIVFHKKPKTEKKSNTITLFCPNCGIEYKVNRKSWEKTLSGLPTCGCGTKMGIDATDEINDSAANDKNAKN